jgi:hypothetical protein
MNKRQRIGSIIAPLGLLGMLGGKGGDYLIACWSLVFIGCLLWFIPARNKKKE